MNEIKLELRVTVCIISSWLYETTHQDRFTTVLEYMVVDPFRPMYCISTKNENKHNKN